MYLVKIPNKKSGRIFLQISESYRENGRTRQRKVKALGYLDELEKSYEDPIAHFTEVAKQMTQEKKAAHAVVSLPIMPAAELVLAEDLEEANRKNIGYTALSSIYHQLEIDYFINNRRRYTKAEFNHNAIFKLLVFDRVLFPSSKRGAWYHKDRFFEKMDFSLEDVYHSLSFFSTHKDAYLKALHTRISKLYGRDTSLVYYDVTNYYFEIDTEDRMRKKGVSKEHRPEPIVQMGLFMDERGLPISYGLYPGNQNDCTTLLSMMAELTYDFDMEDVIVVADKGMMTGNNVSQIRAHHNGNVISYSVRGANAAFKQYVLDEEGYIPWGADAKYKSRFYPRTIQVSDTSGKKHPLVINERQIVFYSQKYADKAKEDRKKVIEKAREMADNPSKRSKAKRNGAGKYLHTIPYDEQGQVLEHLKEDVVFDEEKLAAEEQLDGYYVIMTNVIGTDQYTEPFIGKSRFTEEGYFQLNRTVTDTDIIEMYKGLWKIEETFKVTKTTLQARPVYLSREDHIEAHFLVCFTALVILRILEHLLEGTYGSAQLVESLRQANGTSLENGYYVFDYYDHVLQDLGRKLGLDFSKKYRTKGDIRTMVGKTKKVD